MMATNVLTSEEFAANLPATMHLKSHDPVIVLEDGLPAHVWLSYGDFERLTESSESNARVTTSASERTLLDLFDDAAFDHWPEDFEFPKLEVQLKVPDFS